MNPNLLRDCLPQQLPRRGQSQYASADAGQRALPCDPGAGLDWRVIGPAIGRAALTTLVLTSAAPIQYSALATYQTAVSITVPLGYTCNWVRFKLTTPTAQIAQAIRSRLVQGSTPYNPATGYTSAATGDINDGWLGQMFQDAWVPLPQTTSGGNVLLIQSILTSAYQTTGATPFRSLIFVDAEIEAFIESDAKPC